MVFIIIIIRSLYYAQNKCLNIQFVFFIFYCYQLRFLIHSVEFLVKLMNSPFYKPVIVPTFILFSLYNFLRKLFFQTDTHHKTFKAFIYILLDLHSQNVIHIFVLYPQSYRLWYTMDIWHTNDSFFFNLSHVSFINDRLLCWMYLICGFNSLCFFLFKAFPERFVNLLSSFSSSSTSSIDEYSVHLSLFSIGSQCKIHTA